MKKYCYFLIACLCLGSAYNLSAQTLQKPSAVEIAQLPSWAQKMYGARPNVWEVESAYLDYYRNHPFEKNYHTQYYKRWRRAIADRIDDQGFPILLSAAELEAERAAYARKMEASSAKVTSGNWSPVGPISVRDNSGIAKASHINTYSLARAASDPNIMFCGTEPGEIYKSTDAGINWTCMTINATLDGGVTALEIHPTNANIVFAGSGNFLLRSTNGGNTWATVLNVGGLQVNEFRISTVNTQLVYACTEKGLYRSIDGGSSFSQLYPQRCYDMKWHPTDPTKAYMVKNNPALIQSEFYTSSDTGATWTLQTNGWYSSTDPARIDYGARLAVTPADPTRVYAYLIGEAKAGDVGFIGLYRSDDQGLTWQLPNGPTGGPYSTQHPNLARGTTTWQYHQGFYNCALMASTTNADQILIGGLNLWRSDDAGLTFSNVAGYMGGPLSMHVDNQDFRAFGTDYWITTDGGIYHGNDFFTTQPAVLMQGIHAADYWGFGQGWNEDVMVGGLYHNGNNAYHQNYPPGDFLSLGGGEAPTGYVNPGLNRRTFFSDIGGRLIPLSITGSVTGIPFGLAPNETYFSAESSELEFHPNCYNIAFLGKDNGLWRTDDGGGAFNLVHAFGTDANSQVKYIEISSSNPQVMYVSQQPSAGNSGQIWKTTDAGASWSSIPMPATGNRRRILMALDPEDDNHLWIALPQASNGSKVWVTTNGGNAWTNLTTSMLDGESAHSLVHIGGSANGIYFCSNNTIYYRDDNLTDWEAFNTNLPLQYSTNIARAFYRDGKLRAASYGKGIWESPLHTPQSHPVCRPMANALSAICSADTFFFEDHSMLNHTAASWAWTFQGGTPATSNLRNPAVTFASNGSYLVTLTVTDANGQSDTDSMRVELTGVAATSIATDFEGNFPPPGYTTAATGNLSWAQVPGVGGYGTSSTSTKCDNFNVDGGGSSTDLRAYVNLSQIGSTEATFDVAYAEYGGQYTDTLEVLASNDCGLTFTRLYRKGGQGLATAPNLTSGEYVPAANEWRTDTVDLSSFTGSSEVVIAFRSIGHFGQSMYLDNINIAGTPLVGLSSNPAVNFAQIVPNPVMEDGRLQLRSNLEEAFELRMYDLQGKLLGQFRMQAGESIAIAQMGLSAGNYYYMLAGESAIYRGKIMVLKGR